VNSILSRPIFSPEKTILTVVVGKIMELP
jgi:hypothetical protein